MDINLSSLDIQLCLAYPPTSNRDFSYLKKEPVVKEIIKNSSLYLIAQRRVLTFENLTIDDDQTIHFEIKQKGSDKSIKGSFPSRQKLIVEDTDCEILLELGSDDKNNKFESQPYNNINGIRFWDNDQNFLLWLTPERLLYFHSRNEIEANLSDYQEFLTYFIHYVGKSTDQDIWSRLTGHEKLQDILSKENPWTFGSIPTDEIAILFIKIRNYEATEIKDLTQIDTELSDEEFAEQLKVKKIPNLREIFLDAEKIFTNLLNPEYNEVKFKNYPYSADGLYHHEYNVFTYRICENIILYCNENKIIGSFDSKKSDYLFILDNKEIIIMRNV